MSNLDGLLEVLRLKALPRAGWVRKDVPSPESVAAHSYGVAWLVLALAPPELDRERALTYAILHDLPEVRVGDLTPVDGVPKEEKHRRESAAIDGLSAKLGMEFVANRWHAYETQDDAESRFVRELDRLDMALQALSHHEAGHPGMREFVTSAAKVIRHPALVPILREIERRIDA